MTNTALAVRETRAVGMPSLQSMLEDAKILVKSGLLPVHIKTPEQAVVIMLKGRELGIPPTVALNHMYTVGQKIGMEGVLVQALLRRDGHTYVIDEETPTRCRMRFWRKGDTHDGYEVETTMAEAKQAGWNMEPEYKNGQKTGNMKEKYTWRTMPATMLMWRCLAKGARRYCSDSLCGMSMLAEMNIDPDDELIDGEIVSGEQVRKDHAPLANSDNRGRLFKTTDGGNGRTRATAPEPPADFEEGEYEEELESKSEGEPEAEAPQGSQPIMNGMPKREPEVLSWIDNPPAQRRFFAKVKHMCQQAKIKPLSEDEVHQACKGRLHDTPSETAALEMVQRYLDTVAKPRSSDQAELPGVK